MHSSQRLLPSEYYLTSKLSLAYSRAVESGLTKSQQPTGGGKKKRHEPPKGKTTPLSSASRQEFQRKVEDCKITVKS